MCAATTNFRRLSDADLIEGCHLIDAECSWAAALCAELKRRGLET
jgi:hypothetical protein